MVLYFLFYFYNPSYFRKHATKLSNSSVTLSQYEKIQDELDSTRKDVKTANRERDAAVQEKVSELFKQFGLW